MDAFDMTSARRVLYVRQAPYPWDIRVEKICKALHEHGFEVEILARRGAGEPSLAEYGGMAIHRVGPQRPRVASLPLPWNPIWQHALHSRVRAFKPDLLIARDLPVALFTASAARAASIPWIFDMAEHYPAGMRSWKKYQTNPLLRMAVGPLRLPDRIERRAVRSADGIMTVCEEQKQRLVREYGAAAENIVPVLNTPARARFAAIPPRTPNPGRLRFGYHGMISQDRDLLTILRGFDLAAAQNPAITLDIAGFGESVADLNAEIGRLRSCERISMSGAFTHADVDRLYSEIDFGICCCELSTFSENAIANKFFDYAACGRPFVFTAQGPMLRLMETMRCGIAYKGGDPEAAARAMLQIASGDYAKLAANGRRAVNEQFNWETDVARMLAFFERVVEMRHTAQPP